MMNSPETRIDFETNERQLLDRTFDETKQLIADYYEVPKISKASEMTYAFSEATTSDRARAFPIRSLANSYNFVLNVPDYQFFNDEFVAYMGDNTLLHQYNLDQLGRTLYIGSGITQLIVEQDVGRKATSPRTIKSLREKFASHDDIDELFLELFPDNIDEIDSAWQQSKHIGDEEAIKINAIRASLEYLFNVIDNQQGEALHAEIINQSRTALERVMTTNRGQYLDIGMFGFGRDPEVCNEVFMGTVPEWLISMALPLDTEFLRNK